MELKIYPGLGGDAAGRDCSPKSSIHINSPASAAPQTPAAASGLLPSPPPLSFSHPHTDPTISSSSMEGRHVHVTVVSAEGLRAVKLFSKMHTYASVWIDPSYRLPTAVDQVGGAKPRWNHPLSLPVPEHFFQQPNASLTIEIYCKGPSNDKFLGAASVPLSEVAQGAGQESEKALAVRRRSGKVKGSVRVSVRVGERTVIWAPPPPAFSVTCVIHAPYSPAAYGQVSSWQQPAFAAPCGAYPAPYPPAAYGRGSYWQQPTPYPAMAAGPHSVGQIDAYKQTPTRFAYPPI